MDSLLGCRDDKSVLLRSCVTGAVVFNTELHPKPLLVGVSVMERLGGGLLTRTSDVEYETCLAHDLLSALVHLKEAGLVHGDCRVRGIQ